LDQIRNAKGEALTRDDLLGTRFWDVFPEEVGTAIYDKYIEAARQRRVVHYETHSEATLPARTSLTALIRQQLIVTGRWKVTCGEPAPAVAY
jgi:hypothetical protein